MYLHLPAQTAADFDEALRCMAVGVYTAQNLYREETFRDPGQIIELSSLFAEGLKLSGATPQQPGSGWDLDNALVCIVIPAGQAKALLELLLAFPVDKGARIVFPEWPNVREGFLESLGYVAEQLRMMLALPPTARSWKVLQNVASWSNPG